MKGRRLVPEPRVVLAFPPKPGAPKMYQNSAIISEREDGWVVDPPGGIHDTAADALRWIQARDARDVEFYGVSRVTTIEWRPNSSTGRMVVRALAGQ